MMDLKNFIYIFFLLFSIRVFGIKILIKHPKLQRYIALYFYFDNQSDLTYTIILFYYCIIGTITTVLLSLYLKFDIEKIFSLQINFKDILITIVAFVGIIGLNSLVFYLTFNIKNYFKQQKSNKIIFGLKKKKLFYFLFLYRAIIDEVMFRGILMVAFKNYYNLSEIHSLTFIAVVYAVEQVIFTKSFFHPIRISLDSIFISVICGMLVLSTQTVILPVTLHITYTIFYLKIYFK